MGISIKPTTAYTISAYADFYSFKWLRYRVNAPTTGSDYVIQLNYKPNKIFEIYTRFKAESKSINYNPNNITLNPVIPQPKQAWRTHLVYKINPQITFKTRVEAVWFDKRFGKRKWVSFIC